MSAAAEWDESTRLVDLLLAEDRRPTAVDEFSAYHDTLEHDRSSYEALLPTSMPGDDQQYGFRVDLDACTGCKACVTACHSLNGLEEGESWRRVGLLESEAKTGAIARPQTVTAACHHCEEPGCMAGCPVRAYDKDPVTGVVHHLDDQCIGCRYCQLMCPYDVPQYSERLGIVRKCDMCRGRLAEGEAPACVQGCPNGAISIALVETTSPSPETTMLDVATGTMPSSALTRPSTRYVTARETNREEGERAAADLVELRPAEAHTPLAVMLVLTQAAIGATLLDALGTTFGARLGFDPAVGAVVMAIGAVLGLTGLAASIFHLGRPQWAFRAVLGLRTSWMSREIVALGAYSGLLVASTGLAVLLALAPAAWLESMPWLASARTATAWAATAAGALGLTCSTLLYAVTGRPLWRADRTAIRFVGTTISLGLAISLVALEGAQIFGATAVAPLLPAIALIATTFARLSNESGRLIHTEDEAEAVALARSRALLGGDLASLRTTRIATLIGSGIVVPSIVLVLALLAPASAGLALVLAIVGLATAAVSEFCERSLFFRAEAMPSMPGAAMHITMETRRAA